MNFPLLIFLNWSVKNILQKSLQYSCINLGYVFGLKTVNKGDTKRSPGPAAYSVKDRSTRYGADGTPKYSLHYRPKTCQNFNTPGPGKSAQSII